MGVALMGLEPVAYKFTGKYPIRPSRNKENKQCYSIIFILFKSCLILLSFIAK